MIWEKRKLLKHDQLAKKNSDKPSHTLKKKRIYGVNLGNLGENWEEKEKITGYYKTKKKNGMDHYNPLVQGG